MPGKGGFGGPFLAVALLATAAAVITGALTRHTVVSWWLGAEAVCILGMVVLILDRQRRGDALRNETAQRSAELEKTRDFLVRTNEHLVALHTYSRKIAGCTTIQQVCDTATDALVKNLSYDASIFWLWNKQEERLLGVSAAGSAPIVESLPQELTRSGGVLHSLLGEGKTIMVRTRNDDSPEQSQHHTILMECLGLYSVVAAPLIHNNELLGILLAGFQAAHSMDTHDARILESLLNTASDRMATGQLEHLDEKEKTVFSSISTLTGDALARVIMFTGMEEEIENRAAQLRETHERLIKTREIIVQVEKLSSLGRMAAGVIHEINDPLNFLVNILPDIQRDIEGLAEVKKLALREFGQTPEGKQIAGITERYDLDTHLEEMDFLFSRAQEALTKSSRIAMGLKVFAQGGKTPVQMQNLLDIARETFDLIPRKVKGTVEITVEPEREVKWEVNGDRFAQVCMNLIINALDAMEGKGSLTIGGESQHDRAVVFFKDTGPGIPPAVQKKIFDPFFTTKPAGKSTGLGLTICAEIVREFGGLFKVESEPGRGTCFTIVFTGEQRKEFGDRSGG